MKLIRFGEAGQEKPGVIINDKRYDVSEIVSDFNESFFENNGLETLKAALDANPVLPEVDASIRLGSQVARPSKIICIGLNYVDHCRETGAPIPTEPIIFFKSTTSLCGPDDDLIIPKNSTKTDWEVELAFVVGKKATTGLCKSHRGVFEKETAGQKRPARCPQVTHAHARTH